MLAAAETNQSSPEAGRPPTVGDIIAIARAWVAEAAVQLPDFAGAYVFGSLTGLPPDATFPLHRDVDLIVVVTSGTRPMDDNLELLYRGVMVEVGFCGLDAHRDPNTVLADPALAPNIATTTILADPTGLLGPLQRVVAAEYAQRRWVQARCDAEVAMAREHLAAMRQAATPGDGFLPLWFFLNELSGLLAVARLRRPTHRRSLTLLREQLDEQGRPDLHERALALLGSAQLRRTVVQALLQQVAGAFDRAVAVYRTPSVGSFKLHPHLRPYVVEATQELIDEGWHREAVFWIMLWGIICYQALHHDTAADERPRWQADQDAFYTTLGYTTPDAWQRRVDAAEQLADEIFRIAAELVAVMPA